MGLHPCRGTCVSTHGAHTSYQRMNPYEQGGCRCRACDVWYYEWDGRHCPCCGCRVSRRRRGSRGTNSRGAKRL